MKYDRQQDGRIRGIMKWRRRVGWAEKVATVGEM
jgi:hypothetical protein